MNIKSFAKINLGLEVIGKREDGYHEVRTLLQTVSLHDTLEFRRVSEDRIILSGDDQTISWGRNNLIFRAAFLLKERFRVSGGMEIRVTKMIPAGKGLGGGSSNAAMTLYALNEIWGLGLEKKVLIDLGKTLGVDVPFFFEGGLCLGTGRGDDVAPVNELEPLFCLLVLPEISISTASVYGQLQFSLTSHGKDSKIIKFLDSRELGSLENELEETVFRLYPQLSEIKSLFRSHGPELSLVSGTGAAVFGLFSEKVKAEKVLQKLEQSYASLLVELLPRERYRKNLGSGV
ncbi:MAG: 4-(cytidine 5'-diphospho)-2-C-methyl-D-erythritol kinase [Candidatus Aminicenantes bacterium]|jgi:4-diphosphocytidyl-2-C-methyl-D-erythritol kinase